MNSIIGISAFYHDSAAALIKNGKIIAAAQEERFTRIKHDPSFPINSINYILKEGNLNISDVDKFVFYDKPFLKFERLIETYISEAPFGFKQFSKAMPIWLNEKLFLKKNLSQEIRKQFKSFQNTNLYFAEHHFSHAASAFYPSPYKEAIILTLDGVGEWATSSVCYGKDNNIEILKEINFPNSLGLLYSAFTYYIGFRVNSGEYKLMGLAPYGKPIYKKIIYENLIDVKEDGSFRLNQKYFDYCTGLTMVNQKFCDLFKQPIRKPEIDKLTQFHMDIASSIQTVTEEIIVKITSSLWKEFKIKNLCMAGGVALNCVANGKILRKTPFKNIWVQPASGDAGGAIGAALSLWHKEYNNKRIINKNDGMSGSFLGPSFTKNEIQKDLKTLGAKFRYCSQDQMLEVASKSLSEGKAIGWFQGRMEFGPRALGNRSIIGDARSDKMQKILNLKVKFRESFRPFAPSILYEDLKEWFEFEQKSPYMLFVDQVKKDKIIVMDKNQEKLFGIDKLNVKRSIVPAITHVDYTARIQTVHPETNLIYHKLIKKVKSITGCPVIINTSFNIRGEPIVCSPKDAFECFMGTDLDLLVMNNFILYKEEQTIKINKNYKNKYKLD